MKLGKLILPALLALGMAGGFVAAKQNKAEESAAMSSYQYDVDIDVGLNLKANNTCAADWTIAQFYVNSFESTDVSGGDYLAIRLRSNYGGASYFDVIPNVGGNAYRIGNGLGFKCIPGVRGGVAFDKTARDWDLPINCWQDADLWYCIPKTAFTRDYFATGNPIDWSQPLFAIYFMFYGTTIDVVDFDLGNVYTANIDGEGHLVKVNRLFNWANGDGIGYAIDSGNLGKLTLTRNNTHLRRAARLIQNMENVDACDQTQCVSCYNSSYEHYNSLSESALIYFRNYSMYDYVSGDTAHANGKTYAWSANGKWEQISFLSGHGPSPARYVSTVDNRSSLIIVITITAITSISTVGLIIINKRRKLYK